MTKNCDSEVCYAAYYQKAYADARQEIKELRCNLKAHKNIISSLADEQAKREQVFRDKILILKQINEEIRCEKGDIVIELEEKIDELKEQLDHKEYLLQSKEKKWADFEKIVVEYARADIDLRKKLDDIGYICDDPSSKRKISTVIHENEELRQWVSELKSQLQEAQSNADPIDYQEPFRLDVIYAGEQSTIRTNNFMEPKAFQSEKQVPNRKLSESRRLTEVLGNNLRKPPLPSHFGATLKPEVRVDKVKEFSGSTNEWSGSQTHRPENSATNPDNNSFYSSDNNDDKSVSLDGNINDEIIGGSHNAEEISIEDLQIHQQISEICS